MNDGANLSAIGIDHRRGATIFNVQTIHHNATGAVHINGNGQDNKNAWIWCRILGCRKDSDGEKKKNNQFGTMIKLPADVGRRFEQNEDWRG